MKEIQVNQFDDNDYQNMEMLRSLGINRNMAHVIVYMSHTRTSRSKDIEIVTGLRQPQISMAMKKIRALSWIDETYSKKVKGAKGRRFKIYNMNVSIQDILNYYDRQKYNEYMKHMNVIESLKINLMGE